MNGRSRRTLGVWVLLAVAVIGCTRDQRPVLTVYAAASLRDVLSELREPFERDQGARLQFNFAGSGVLAQQILAAPRADLFLSASPEWIDRIERAGRAVPGSRRELCANRLVVVGRDDCGVLLDSPERLVDADYRHLAIAQPEAVPAGQYARDWLVSASVDGIDLWQLLAPRLTPTLDVRATLALVESSPRVLGVVYASDVLASERAVVLYEPPPGVQPSIRYEAIAIASSAVSVEAGGSEPGRPVASSLATAFLDLACSDGSLAVYRRHGFLEP